MATFRLPVLGFASAPDTSGDVFLESYAVKATNDFWKKLVVVFDDTATKIGLHGSFSVPQNYVGTANLVIVWTSTATSGDVEWDFDYRAVGGNDSESLDQATAQESVNANDTAPSATDERMEISIALTDANFLAGDTVSFVLYRDGTDGGDTIAASVTLHDLFFEYADV
jgi:putative transposon-encoded protein